jgi:hypothetical protein
VVCTIWYQNYNHVEYVIELVVALWPSLEGGDRLQNIVVCYDTKCTTWLKCNLYHVYVNSWTLSPCNLVFKCELYLKFILLTIKNVID